MYNLLKKISKTALQWTGLLPYYYLCSDPFKIYEWIIMNNLIEANSHGTVLDLGCGSGFKTMIISKNFSKVVGIDPDERAIKQAKKNLTLSDEGKLQFFNKTIEHMNFPDNSYDGVISYCVLEHIPNYKEVLSEIKRVLKPNGWFLLSVDCLSLINEQNLLDKHRSDCDVVTYFRPKEIEILLAELKFTNISIKPIFKSRFATTLFKRGIINCFRYNKLISLIYAGLLFLTEGLNRRNNEGIQLIVKAYKSF